MQIKDLKPNQRNPRKMSDKKLSMLLSSLKKFGDLSGFVYNRRSKTLIGGHQKQKVIPPNCQIKIEHKYEKPTASMTVAEGHVLIEGEKFKYREVDADEQWEMEAVIAANKHQGEWDTDILKLASADFKGMNWELAGFEIPELRQFGISAPVFPSSMTSALNSPVSEDGGDVEEDAEDSDVESDEDYVRNTPQSTEQIHTQQTGSPHVDSRNAFGDVKEVTEAPNRRIVIIIDCPTQEIKDSLKDQLRSSIEGAGAKLF